MPLVAVLRDCGISWVSSLIFMHSKLSRAQNIRDKSLRCQPEDALYRWLPTKCPMKTWVRLRRWTLDAHAVLEEMPCPAQFQCTLVDSERINIIEKERKSQVNIQNRIIKQIIK